MGKGNRTRSTRAPEAQGDEDPVIASIREAVRSVGRSIAILTPRYWLAITITAAIAAGIVYLALPMIPGSQNVDLALKAGKGTTQFSLAAEDGGVSPGCGCPHPEYGRHTWEGMSMPSRGFQLDVETQASDEVDENLWALTAMAPNTGPMDWYGEPDRAVWIEVDTKEHGGWWKPLFYGPASHLLLWSDDPVVVRQPRRNPYAAVLPAAEGSTTFTTREPSRSQWQGRVDVSTSAPSRQAADPKEARMNPEVRQRGPMIDLLGSTIVLSTPYSKSFHLWAGRREITGGDPGDKIVIYVSTPFALRLIPHPVQLDWKSEVEEATSEAGLLNLFSGRTPRAETKPVGMARLPLRQALPSFTVKMSHVRPPDPEDWASFASRSEEKELTSEMMGFTGLDPLPTRVWESGYALPPVTPHPQIGVFGRITKFDSESVGGTAVVGSDPLTVARGEELELDSDDGLAAGRYHFTPLVSSGQETAETSIYGSATVHLGGELLSHPDWVPWGLISALATAVLGIFLGAAFKFWASQREVEEPSP